MLFQTYFYHPCCFETRQTYRFNHHSTYSYSGIGSIERALKELCFTTPSLAVETMGVRLGVVKQSFFGLPGQYGRRVTRANSDENYVILLGYFKGDTLLVK